MKNFGRSAISEFLADHIVYRNLVPVEQSLPGLKTIFSNLGLENEITPRKTQPAYASVIAYLLQEAQRQRKITQPIRDLVFIGDTRLLDGTAFSNLCQAGHWRGVAFIGAETTAPPSYQIEQRSIGEVIYLSNRWSGLVDFEQYCAAQGIMGDESTVVVIDMDKTSLGARGRNAHTIDQARVNAVQQTVSALLGASFDLQVFQTAYNLFNQVEFHTFTADNQDYLAYICLMIGSGMDDASRLASQVRTKKLASIDAFIAQIDHRRKELPDELAVIHEDIYRLFQAGDPTHLRPSAAMNTY